MLSSRLTESAKKKIWKNNIDENFQFCVWKQLEKNLFESSLLCIHTVQKKKVIFGAKTDFFFSRQASCSQAALEVAKLSPGEWIGKEFAPFIGKILSLVGSLS